MAERVLKIGCMDPRCRAELDKGNSALLLSRAGGWLGGNLKTQMPHLLRQYEIETLDIRTHDKCGAIKVVDMAIRSQYSVNGIRVQRYRCAIPEIFHEQFGAGYG